MYNDHHAKQLCDDAAQGSAGCVRTAGYADCKIMYDEGCLLDQPAKAHENTAQTWACRCCGQGRAGSAGTAGRRARGSASCSRRAAAARRAASPAAAAGRPLSPGARPCRRSAAPGSARAAAAAPGAAGPCSAAAAPGQGDLSCQECSEECKQQWQDVVPNWSLAIQPCLA